jgi:co-chaperonin GroES (HSP10)
MTETTFRLTPTTDWVVVLKVDSPFADAGAIYTVGRDPNGAEYGRVLRVGPDVPADALSEGDTVLLGAGVGDAVKLGNETVHFIQWSRRDIKAVVGA